MSARDRIITALLGEWITAEQRWGGFHSSHEGLGVLLEEVAELMEAIRQNDLVAIEHEAIQVGTTAARLAAMCSDPQARARSVP